MIFIVIDFCEQNKTTVIEQEEAAAVHTSNSSVV